MEYHTIIIVHSKFNSLLSNQCHSSLNIYCGFFEHENELRKQIILRIIYTEGDYLHIYYKINYFINGLLEIE